MPEAELAQIVGSGNVLDSPEILEQYSRDWSFVPAIRPRCVIKPADAREICEIVKWANRTSTALVPVSSGFPHFRGDTVPGSPAAVVIDLGRLRRVVRVDPRNRIAMIEPGVTFGELQAKLAGDGLCAYMPLAPRATKSVIGSMLEREPILRPGHHWDSTDPLLCMEVVFGSGDRFRTGEASGPDTVEEQWEMGRVQMNPFGHSHVDFQRLICGAQGTIGIVTWATLKCSPLPAVHKALFVPSPGIEPLIDLSYRFTRFRFGGHLFILNSLNLACLLGRDAAEIEALKAKLPPWVLYVSFEGHGPLPEEKVAYEEADFRSIAGSFDLKPETQILSKEAEDLYRVLQEPPEPYWKTKYQGRFQDIFCLTTLDRIPTFAASVTALAGRCGFAASNMGVYIQPVVQGTSCHCEFNLYYDPDKSLETGAVRNMVSAGSEDIAQMGGFFSRPYPAWKDTAYRRAAGTAEMQRKIKRIFDPNEILNPGKLCF